MAAITPITIGRAAFGSRTTKAFNQPAYASVPPSIDYLIIAGGGGGGQGPGGNYTGGGGGAGGVVQGTGYSVSPNRTYTVVVGGGGPGAPGGNQNGVDGSNSGFYATATSENTWAKGGGGGGGGSPADPIGSQPRSGRTGGSGGGGSQRDGSGAPGTPGQGNAGGSGCNGPAGGNGGGGGGFGAGGSKGLGPNDSGWPAAQPTSPFATGVGGWGNGGLGGVGLSTTFDGTPNAFAGGGAGGGDLGVRSFGGRNGGPVAPYPANEPFGGGESTGPGSNQKGGGGGGAGSNPAGSAGSGGSGIFWIRYPAEYAPIPNYSGLSSYNDNGTYKIYKWNGGGSWSWDTPGVNPAP